MNASQREVAAKQAASTLDRLIQLAFAYDRRKGLSQTWFRRLDRWKDIIKEVPATWEDVARGSLAALAVWGPGPAAAGFVRAEGDRLPDDELSLARRWRSVPWMMMAFHIIKPLGPGFLQVRPWGSQPAFWPADQPWGDLELYSPNLSTRQETRNHAVVALVWNSPAGWHTWGPILAFPGWGEKDFGYLMSVAREAEKHLPPTPLRGTTPPHFSLTAALTQHAAAAQVLFRWSETPVFEGPLGPVRNLVAFASFEGVPLDEVTWWEKRARARGERVGVFNTVEGAVEVYLGEGAALRDPWYTVSLKDKRIYLGATGEEAYQRGVRFFTGVVDFPDDPIIDTVAAIRLVGDTLWPEPKDQYALLSEQFQKMADEEVLSPERQKALDSLQTIAKRLIDNHNEGIAETVSETALALGVPLDEVEDVAHSLQAVLRRQGPQRSLEVPPRVLEQLALSRFPRAEGALVPRDLPVDQVLLEAAPVIQVLRWFASEAALGGGRVPATSSGYLDPKKLTSAKSGLGHLDPSLYSPSYPRREGDWPWFLRHRKVLELAGLISLDKRGFLLTDRARTLLDQPKELYDHLLMVGLFSAQWGSTEENVLKLQASIRSFHGLLLYALGVLSQKEKNKEKWTKSPKLARVWLDYLGKETNASLEILAESGVNGLLVRGLFHSLGLVEIHPKDLKDWRSETRVRPSELYQSLFEVIPPPA